MNQVLRCGMASSGRKHAAAADVRDALASSLRLEEMMRAAQPALLRLLGGDHAALGLVRNQAAPEVAGAAFEPRRLQWIPSAGLPPAFFADYERWIAHDFVLNAVLRHPREVLLDSEMISRAALEANPFHRRARELGVPLQHVMAVMLDVDEVSSGFALYRQGKRSFRDRERATLQALVPALVQAVRNCCRFESAERHNRVLERVLSQSERAVIVFDTGGREVFRTQRAAHSLERWFAGASRRGGALPPPLSSAVMEWLARVESAVPVTFPRPGSESVLVVTPQWITDSAQSLLSLVLEERPRPPWSPAKWARLTRRQRSVIAGVVRGWDNKLIASELGCEVATVKRHLTQVYDRLGVNSRAQLMAATLAAGHGASEL